jgi:hypothetical protein
MTYRPDPQAEALRASVRRRCESLRCTLANCREARRQWIVSPRVPWWKIVGPLDVTPPNARTDRHLS